jgi:predicted nucleic acid-binding protein
MGHASRSTAVERQQPVMNCERIRLVDPEGPLPSGIVLRWLAAQEPSAVFIAAITQAEILYAIELLQPSKRRARLSAAIEEMFGEEFQDRILPFDVDAARALAKIVADRLLHGPAAPAWQPAIPPISRVVACELSTHGSQISRALGGLRSAWD